MRANLTRVVCAVVVAATLGSAGWCHVPTQLIGQWGGPCNAVAVAGNRVYFGVGPRLVVLDTSNPASRSVLGTSPVLPGVVKAVAVSGSHAYVAAHTAGLQIIDITDPANPLPVGAYRPLKAARRL